MVALLCLMLLPESLHVRGLEVALAAQDCGRQQVPDEITEVTNEPLRYWDVKAFFPTTQNLGRHHPAQGTAEQIFRSEALELQRMRQRTDMGYEASIEQGDTHLQ